MHMSKFRNLFIRLSVIVGASLPMIATAATLTNPLGTTDPRRVVANLITALLGITGALALLMFVWGGVQWLTSGGAPDKVKKGKDTLIWATIGLAVIIMAYALVKAVVTALESGTVG